MYAETTKNVRDKHQKCTVQIAETLDKSRILAPPKIYKDLKDINTTKYIKAAKRWLLPLNIYKGLIYLALLKKKNKQGLLGLVRPV